MRREPIDERGAALPPSEAMLFAWSLLGKPAPIASQAAADSRSQQERLQWLAEISSGHESRLRRPLSEERLARTQCEQSEWLAEISTVHEAEWDPAKHPRRGTAPNAGWFATKGSGSTATGPTPNQASPIEVPPVATQPVTTRTQLPADHRGTWVSGTKGNGDFRYNDSLENQRAGLAGTTVRFEHQHIAAGGIPAGAYFGGNASSATVEIDTVSGTRADNRRADAKMRAKLDDRTWRRPKGYVWNHAGTPGSKTMELVKSGVHEKVAHKGPAAEPRAARRIAGAAKATGRAMGALTVYLTARDVLQTSGALQPDFEVAAHEAYHFVAEDGSVFVVVPAGWLSNAKRQFVRGPRKGQTERISAAAVGQYRKQAEKEWGKYTPGSLFSEPRFIPGTKRSELPLIEYRFGARLIVGWIDEHGVHYFPDQRGYL